MPRCAWQAQARVADVEAQMLEVLGQCLQAVQSELSFIPLANAFELFGMDLAGAQYSSYFVLITNLITMEIWVLLIIRVG